MGRASDIIGVSNEQWRRTRMEVRWNGVCWHDIKSGGVEAMISLAATATLHLKKFFNDPRRYGHQYRVECRA